MKILVVDDHPVIAKACGVVLEPMGVETIISASTADAGYQAFVENEPDVSVIDLSLHGEDLAGITLIKRIRSYKANAGILVFSMRSEEHYARRSFRAGAAGYITKDRSSGELVKAIRKVIGGGRYLSPGLAETLVADFDPQIDRPPHHSLSDREFEVLRRVASGQRLTEIGEALHLSVKTVSTHKAHIQEKLQLTSTAELIRYAMENSIE